MEMGKKGIKRQKGEIEESIFSNLAWRKVFSWYQMGGSMRLSNHLLVYGDINVTVFINKQENKTEKYLHRAYHHLPANYTFKIVFARQCVCIEWWGKVQQRHTLIKPFELNKERHQYSQHCLLCDHCSQRIQTSVSIVSWSASCCPITNAAITPVI